MNLDNRLISSIIKTKKKINNEKRHNDISLWAKKNKKDIDRVFSILLNVLDTHNLELEQTLENFYNRFITFAYDNSLNI